MTDKTFSSTYMDATGQKLKAHIVFHSNQVLLLAHTHFLFIKSKESLKSRYDKKNRRQLLPRSETPFCDSRVSA